MKKEIKNISFPSAATWMDLESIMLKWSKSDRERQILYDIIYMWNLKYTRTSEYYKKEADSYIERTN